MGHSLEQIDKRIIACERCPRLRAHCLNIAKKKRASFAGQTYWGLPVPNLLGQPKKKNKSVQLLVVGLAPAAHGANRTGRMFTGDRSGDFLFEGMHRAGFTNQPTGNCADDGLQLLNCAITAAAHCAPPDNKPTRQELDNCSEYLQQTYDALTDLKIIVALGKMGHDSVLRMYKQRGWIKSMAPYKFAHGAIHNFKHQSAVTICNTYHPSQQNTFTGRLTMDMLSNIFKTAREIIEK